MISGIVKKEFVVQEGDIDELQHVNNRVYLRWMEESAREASAAGGWDSERYFHDGDGVWVAREHWVEYLRPSFEGERLEMFSWIQGWRAAASLRRYAIRRADELIFVGATEWVFVDYEKRRPALFADEQIAVLEKYAVSPEDPVLESLGIARSVRYLPSRGL